jgi:hypothetical protein
VLVVDDPGKNTFSSTALTAVRRLADASSVIDNGVVVSYGISSSSSNSSRSSSNSGNSSRSSRNSGNSGSSGSSGSNSGGD